MINRVGTVSSNYTPREVANTKPRKAEKQLSSEIQDKVSFGKTYSSRSRYDMKKVKRAVAGTLGAIGGAFLGAIGGGAGGAIAAVTLGVTGALTGAVVGGIIAGRSEEGFGGLARSFGGAVIGAVAGGVAGVATGLAAGAAAPIIGGITGVVAGGIAGISFTI